MYLHLAGKSACAVASPCPSVGQARIESVAYTHLGRFQNETLMNY